MGGHPYWYFVPFQPDLGTALRSLREREFKAGRYALARPDLAATVEHAIYEIKSVDEFGQGQIKLGWYLDLLHTLDPASNWRLGLDTEYTPPGSLLFENLAGGTYSIVRSTVNDRHEPYAIPPRAPYWLRTDVRPVDWLCAATTSTGGAKLHRWLPVAFTRRTLRRRGLSIGSARSNACESRCRRDYGRGCESDWQRRDHCNSKRLE
jgi:hypothetical protein